jgi:hypothetical protein
VQLVETGVINGLFSYYNNLYRAVGWKSEVEGPQVLTYNHLQFWIELWGCLLILSLASFVCEHFSKFFSSKVNINKILNFLKNWRRFHGKKVKN